MLKRSFTVLATLVAASALAGCGTETEIPRAESTPTAEATGPSCTYVEAEPPAKEAKLPSDRAAYAGEVDVTITTNVGELSATLDADAAPCTVNSFLSLAEQGYFGDTPCHRLTTKAAGIQVLQCGDPSGSGSGGPGYSFADELTGQETYDRGTLAMANAGPNTNGSQFFVVYGDSPLPPAYTVFGSLTEESIAVVEDVAAAGTQTGEPDGAPKEPVQIETVTRD